MTDTSNTLVATKLMSTLSTCHWGYENEVRLRECFGPLQDLPARVGCHVVSFEDAGTQFGLYDDNGGRGWGGYTSAILDVQLEPMLRAAHRWTDGRAFATIIKPELHDTDSSWATVCHEFAHWLASPDAYRDLPREQWTDPTAANITPHGYHLLREHSKRLAPHLVATPTSLPLPWAGHDAAFIRCALHIYFRANRVQSGLTFPSGVAGDSYGLSNWSVYFGAMRAELHDRLQEPIRTILLSDPPAALSRLFQSDIDQYTRYKEWQRSGKWGEQAAYYAMWRDRHGSTTKVADVAAPDEAAIA